jgi:hypothetical protein
MRRSRHAEQQAIVDSHEAAESRRAIAELDLLPAKFREQSDALIVEHRRQVAALNAEQQAEVVRVKTIRPVSTERYEIVQF